MRYLILENDNTINERIIAFINSSYFKDGDSFPDISGLAHKELSPHNYIEFKECDTYIFSTTFNDSKQIGKILQLIGSQEKPKHLYINYLTDRLYIGLQDICNNYPEEIKQFRDGGHKISEITYETKNGNNSGTFFKDIRYFFDLIPYYWNDDYGLFFPERPVCIYQDNNINEIFKYKPKWIKR